MEPECTCKTGSANGKHWPDCPLVSSGIPNRKGSPPSEPETVVVEYKGCCQ